MTPTVFDWILVAVFMVVMPAWSWFTWPGFVAAAKANEPGVRVRAYVHVIVSQWALCLTVLAWWLACGRPWPALGLGDPFEVRAPWVVVVAIAGLAAYHVRVIARTPAAELARGRAGLGEVLHLLPQGPLEGRLFRVVAITAGVCEELFYRGFVPWALTMWLPPWAAIAVTTLVFGLAHAYQGPSGIVKTAIVGGVMAGLVLWSGTLWPAMLLHAIIDVHGGIVGGRVASATPEPEPDPDPDDASA
jgi:membrane protease YdiL (CAAX protease family)